MRRKRQSKPSVLSQIGRLGIERLYSRAERPAQPRSQPRVCRPLLVVVCVAVLSCLTQAQEQPPLRPPLVREIFVPYEDLNVVLEAEGRRVFLTRDEYETLLSRASKSPEKPAPHAVALLSAEYDATVEDSRARISGKILIEVAADGLQAIPLPLGQVGLRRATVDGLPASISRPNGKAMLFVEGRGRHELLLEMVVPVEVAAARQTIQYLLPTAATGQVRWTVPGDVEMKSGAHVLNRVVDEAASVTRFQLLPSAGTTTLVMTLNNKLAQRGQVVLARSVVVDELTEAYERVHVTASLKVIHGAAEQFRFSVPPGFEIISVSAPTLSRWEVSAEDGASVLQVFLRSPVTDGVVINLAAQRTPGVLSGWSMPQLQPLDVVGSISVVGLLAEQRLRLASLSPDGLIPIDTRTLTNTLPPSLFVAEPGAPTLRPVAAFYAPQTAYDLTATLDKPDGRVDVTSNILLIIQGSGFEVHGGFSLTPTAERIFGCNLSIEPGWHVNEVTYEGQPLAFQTYDMPDGASRIRIMLPRGVPPGESYNIHFHATRTPDGWLDTWPSQSVRFPQFAVTEATSERGAVAVEVRDDLNVRPVQAQGLTPLDENKKAEFNLAEVPTSLAYRFDSRPFDLSLTVERTPPRITAETYSFLKIEPNNLQAQYEIIYRVAQARSRELSFLLPVDTPGELTVRGLKGARIKEFSSDDAADGLRRWRVQFAEASGGAVHIEVSFQQTLVAQGALDEDGGDVQIADELSLPIIRAADVQYQTGMVAVETSPELEVGLQTDSRKVDVGELVDAQYRPGRRLLGAFGFVGEPTTITAAITRPSGYGLPAAIVQRGEIVTSISAQGSSQTAARFLLHTKSQFLEVLLPEGSTFWSAYLDQMPAKPQREGDRLLVSLPTSQGSSPRDLQIVFETPVSGIGAWGTVALPAPKLFLRGGDESSKFEVPSADLNWHVYLPPGYRLADSGGTVFPDLDDAATRSQLARGRTPLEKVAGVLVASPARGASEAARTGSALNYEDGAAGGTRVDHAATKAFEGGDDMLAGEAEGKYRTAQNAPAQPQSNWAAPSSVAANGAVPERGEVTGESTLPPIQQLGTPVQIDAPSAASSPATRATLQRGTWALEGLRSLKIDMAPKGPQVTFLSLGADPLLDVTLVEGRRVSMLACGAALLVFSLGLAMIRRSVGARLRYVACILIAATLLPLVLGWNRALGTTLDLAFYAALALIPIYLLAGCWRWLCSFFQTWTVQAALVLLLLTSSDSIVLAEDPFKVVTADSIGALTVQVVEPEQPVTVPPDAVIVPYHPEDTAEATGADKVIVPYEKYVELWNLAYPDKPLDQTKPPVEFSFAGARWIATLDGEDTLHLEGQIDLHVHVDRLVAIPLALNGGVILRAELDGEPARIQLVQPAGSAGQLEQQPRQAAVAASANVAPGPDGIASLYVTGKGQRRLELAIRYRVQRRGGWRLVEGRVPALVSNALTLIVPQPQTELRLAGVTDRAVYETRRVDESIETAFSPSGEFRVEWRPRVAQATVDRSLTVESDAVLDVQEDGLRLAWQLNLKFPLGERDFFTIAVPRDYLVEQVIGENVRGWEAADGQLRVTLLKAARDSQQLVLSLARRGPVGHGELSQFNAPVVQVSDALLHEGRLAVRRSPMLELRVMGTEGVNRAEFASVCGAEQSSVESPLGIRPFQAYRFTRTPFSLSLSAGPIESQLSAEVQSILRLTDDERSLESRVILRGEGRPIFDVEMDVPADLEIDDVVAPGEFQWSVEAGENAQLLRVYLSSGQTDEFSIVISGTIGERGPVDSVSLPRIVARNVARQESTIVVQTDPSFDARVDALAGCQTVLLSRAHSWLADEQRTLARVAIHCATDEFTGRVLLDKRTPRLTCQTVSNLRITSRTFEETILLDFTVEDAGLREILFLLPAALRDARVTAPMVRQKTIEDVDGTDQVRVRLQLQDEVMGQYRVLVENDFLLSADGHSVPIPLVESGSTLRRFVALESAGRDEVLVDRQQGLAPLGREQSQWRVLAGMLGNGITQAYLVQPGEASPALTVRTKDRQAVETVGARIPLARTVLSVDASGAYRAVQTYQVDNRTEQYLEVHLPAGARLWTARVAGQPVKPITGQDVVRVPLVKTAEGEQDYPVELKYGGRMDQLAAWTKVSFPLMRTTNINVEESQVRLWLPKSHRWFNFGGSMRLAEADADLLAGYLNYKTQQIRAATENLSSSNRFTQLRAKSNLKNLAKELQDVRELPARGHNARLQQEITANTGALREAEELLVEQERELDEAASALDNRRQLGEFFYKQSNEISRNRVNSQGGNFDDQLGFGVTDESRSTDRPDGSKDQQGQIAADWFDLSGLSNALGDQLQEQQRRVDLGRSPSGREAGQGDVDVRKGRGYAPNVAAGKAIQQLKQQKDEEEKMLDEVRGVGSRDEKERLRRFEQRLEMEQQQAGEAAGGGMGGFGETQTDGRMDAGRYDRFQDGARTGNDANGDSQSGYGRRGGRVSGPRPTTERAPSEPSLAPQDSQLDLFTAPRPQRSAIVGGQTVSRDGEQLAEGQDGAVQTWDFDRQSAVDATPQATGLASLDVRLPTRGVEYLFTTPRGDIEIVARAVDQPLLSRVVRLAWVLAAIMAIYLAYRQLRSYSLDRVVNRGVAILLVLAGVLLLLLGIVPLVAITMAIVGAVQLVRLTLAPKLVHTAV